MAAKEYIFEGKGNYISTKGHDFAEGTKWSMLFFPKDGATRKAVTATGVKNHVKLDDETGEAYFTFRSDEAYSIIDADGKPIEALVGNGSEVKIKLAVETFKSPKFGDCARSKLLEVMVTKLIPYEKPVDVAPAASATTELPA